MTECRNVLDLIPEYFSSIGEAAKFWDIHDLGDYWDLTEEVRFEYTQALTNAGTLRQRIQRWQEAHDIEAEDSAETLRALREEHDDSLAGSL